MNKEISTRELEILDTLLAKLENELASNPISATKMTANDELMKVGEVREIVDAVRARN